MCFSWSMLNEMLFCKVENFQNKKMNVIVNDMKDLQDLKKMIAPPDKTSSNN